VAGQTFSVTVNAVGITDLYAFQFDLLFTPGVLSANSITEGPLLPTGGATAFVPGNIDNVGGVISFSADTLIGAVPGVSGSGTLATVQFNALGFGTSLLMPSNITLLNSALAEITTTNVGATVSVVVPEPGSNSLLLLGLVVTYYWLRRPPHRVRLAPSRRGSPRIATS
jgi:hypothetical protein